DRAVAVGINVAHLRPVLSRNEARILVHELRDGRAAHLGSAATSAAEKIEAANERPPSGTPVELITRDEMAAVNAGIDEIDRDLGLDPTPGLRELRLLLRTELERAEGR